MCANGVTHRELVAALQKQTDTIVARFNRSEDHLKEDIRDNSERITHVERGSRVENLIASTVAAIAAIAVGWYTRS